MSTTTVPLRPIQKGTLIKLWIGVFVLLAAAALFAWCSTARSIAMNGTPEDFLSWNGSQSGVVTTDSGLQYQVLEAGDEAGSPGPGAGVIVNYEGRLVDGTVFDTGEQQGLPLDGVIEGWAEGIQEMSRGARYRFWIPPALGYGETPPPGGPIQADSVIVFDVELLEFISREELMQLQMQQQMQQMGVQPEGMAPPPAQ